MIANTSEIEKIYDFVSLLKMSKRNVGNKYIKITPEFIEDFRTTLRAITQLEEEITDPNLHCLISAVNTEYDLLRSTGLGSAFIRMFPGAVIGAVSSIAVFMILIPIDILEEFSIHKIASFNAAFGAALSGYSSLKSEREKKELYSFKEAALGCSEDICEIEFAGTSSDECKIIT